MLVLPLGVKWNSYTSDDKLTELSSHKACRCLRKMHELKSDMSPMKIEDCRLQTSNGLFFLESSSAYTRKSFSDFKIESPRMVKYHDFPGYGI